MGIRQSTNATASTSNGPTDGSTTLTGGGSGTGDAGGDGVMITNPTTKQRIDLKTVDWNQDSAAVARLRHDLHCTPNSSYFYQSEVRAIEKEQLAATAHLPVDRLVTPASVASSLAAAGTAVEENVPTVVDDDTTRTAAITASLHAAVTSSATHQFPPPLCTLIMEYQRWSAALFFTHNEFIRSEYSLGLSPTTLAVWLPVPMSSGAGGRNVTGIGQSTSYRVRRISDSMTSIGAANALTMHECIESAEAALPSLLQQYSSTRTVSPLAHTHHPRTGSGGSGGNANNGSGSVWIQLATASLSALPVIGVDDRAQALAGGLVRGTRTIRTGRLHFRHDVHTVMAQLNARLRASIASATKQKSIAEPIGTFEILSVRESHKHEPNTATLDDDALQEDNRTEVAYDARADTLAVTRAAATVSAATQRHPQWSPGVESKDYAPNPLAATTALNMSSITEALVSTTATTTGTTNDRLAPFYTVSLVIRRRPESDGTSPSASRYDALYELHVDIPPRTPAATPPTSAAATTTTSSDPIVFTALLPVTALY